MSPCTTHTIGLPGGGCRLAEDVDRARGIGGRLAGLEGRLRRVDVDAAREALAVPEQHRGPQRRIVLVGVEHLP